MIEPGKIAPGQPMRLTTCFQDSVTGNPVDPDTVQAVVISPCGGKTTYSFGTDIVLGKAATGSYYLDVTPNHGGRWFYRWVSTGAGAGAVEGDFNVQRSRFEDCGVPFCWDYR